MEKIDVIITDDGISEEDKILLNNSGAKMMVV